MDGERVMERQTDTGLEREEREEGKPADTVQKGGNSEEEKVAVDTVPSPGPSPCRSIQWVWKVLFCSACLPLLPPDRALVGAEAGSWTASRAGCSKEH